MFPVHRLRPYDVRECNSVSYKGTDAGLNRPPVNLATCETRVATAGAPALAHFAQTTMTTQC